MRQCMDAENLHRRMKKLMGQLQAIDQMIDKDVPCEDILIQINATPPSRPLPRPWNIFPVAASRACPAFFLSPA